MITKPKLSEKPGQAPLLKTALRHGTKEVRKKNAAAQLGGPMMK